MSTSAPPQSPPTRSKSSQAKTNINTLNNLKANNNNNNNTSNSNSNNISLNSASTSTNTPLNSSSVNTNNTNNNTNLKKTLQNIELKMRIIASPNIRIADLFKCFLKNVPKSTETIEVSECFLLGEGR